jgi:hypothetical protein
MLKVEPRRAKERTLKEEPNCTKSRVERDEPSFEIPYSE